MSENGDDPDVEAIPKLLSTLRPLSDDQRLQVLRFVLQKLNIPLAVSDGAQTPSPSHLSADLASALGTEAPPPRAPGAQPVRDIRSLKEQKKPRTATEMVALVAYYLEHLAPEKERRSHITADDIRPYFKEAQFELPAAPPSVTLGHAKNAGYLKAQARGQYQLNAVGYNLVAHKLPSETAAAAKPSRSTPKRKKKKARV